MTAALVVGIGLAVGAYFGTLSVMQFILVIVVIAVVVIPFGILVMRATFDVRVSADGIKAHGYGLNAILISWSAITEVKKSYEGVGLLLLGVLLLETDDKKKSVLVPIATAKQLEFRNAVIQYAGAGHRLVQVLLESVT